MGPEEGSFLYTTAANVAARNSFNNVGSFSGAGRQGNALLGGGPDGLSTAGICTTE